MRVGCYTLDLYCDNPGGDAATLARDREHLRYFPDTFTGETRGECMRNARKSGWLLGRELDRCPLCSGKKPTR